MKIIFFGASAYVIPILEYLRKHFDLVLVVTTEKEHKDAVPTYCSINNISYISVSTLRKENIVRMIRAINAPAAVLAYFGLIIPQEVIDIFPKGIVNIHPSLLPEYRGPTPGQTAILNGETKSGVSIMLLDNKVDHGPLLGQKEEAILSDDTAITFYEHAFKDGTELLERVLPEYLSGKLLPKEQNHTKATFTKTLSREDGFISDKNTPDKTSINRMIRAYHPWPGVWTKCTIPNTPLTNKIIKFLPSAIQVEGKKPMPIKDFLNGYPTMKGWLDKFINP